MRVAIDGRSLQPRPLRGVGRVVEQVLPGIRAAGIDVTLLTDSRFPALTDQPGATHELRAPIRHGTAWLQVAAPNWLADHPQLFHCPWYGLPYRQPVPMVVTIHDLTFEHHPGWFRRGQAEVYRRQARYAARTAVAILTVSHFVAGEIAEYYGVAEDRILVAPNGVAPHFLEPPRAGPLPADLTPGSYLLAIGGAERREVHRAVAAHGLVRKRYPDLRLAVLGGPPIAGTTHLSNLSDDAWGAVMAGAVALVYPTAHEGFGLPAIEALASGTPVVAARVASLPEVLGPVAQWADDRRPESLAEATLALLDAPSRQEQLAEQGRARAATFTWDRAVEAHLEAYRRAGEA